jgi:DNA adenine methylase
MRPFLRWAGSKRQILETLAAQWDPTHRRYLEPFAGSAALFFHLAPVAAVLGDLNEELVNALTVVRDDLASFLELLRSWSPTKAEYCRIRDVRPHPEARIERAARFVFLNRLCFNGLYRTNRNGKFNVPYGGTKAGRMPTDSEFVEASRILRDAVLLSGDFERTLSYAEADDFVYMDPPYSVTEVRTFQEYGPRDFTEFDVKRLRSCLEDLDRRGVTFLVSYAESAAGRALASGFEHRLVTVRRNIAGFAGARRLTNELLIANRALH